uniref:Putative secreted protein n=1 Tax=Anopheles triannulatus TaxID=58253 RepID=A0A2M4B5D8_9DIPT
MFRNIYMCRQSSRTRRWCWVRCVVYLCLAHARTTTTTRLGSFAFSSEFSLPKRASVDATVHVGTRRCCGMEWANGRIYVCNLPRNTHGGVAARSFHKPRFPYLYQHLSPAVGVTNFSFSRPNLDTFMSL